MQIKWKEDCILTVFDSESDLTEEQGRKAGQVEEVTFFGHPQFWQDGIGKDDPSKSHLALETGEIAASVENDWFEVIDG